ncbi:MAG: 3-mercaptopyruvate sulfurtransferase [Alphaproteobacteria bacterium]|nr:3-mercaptopyruvate sulfurtransferase [Alphaproteobacteria bacterium]
MGPLVDTTWLAEHLASVRVLDGSWYLPQQRRDSRAEYAAGHIPGALFFDIDAIADRTTGLPHMLPSPADFAAAAGAMGIANDDPVVVYDGAGLFSAPRVWWTFRVFGHADVAVLDGGLPKWRAEGRPTTTTVPGPAPRAYRARYDSGLVRALGDMRANLASRREQVLDARSGGRFAGVEPEPRPGLRDGHIPGSRNLPFGDLIDAGRGTLLPAAGLRRRFTEAGIDLARPVVTTCGSGISAAVLALGLRVLGTGAAVYDGSWAEWGSRSDTPVEP